MIRVCSGYKILTGHQFTDWFTLSVCALVPFTLVVVVVLAYVTLQTLIIFLFISITL